jgi:hypothetical protein
MNLGDFTGSAESTAIPSLTGFQIGDYGANVNVWASFNMLAGDEIVTHYFGASG